MTEGASTLANTYIHMHFMANYKIAVERQSRLSNSHRDLMFIVWYPALTMLLFRLDTVSPRSLELFIPRPLSIPWGAYYSPCYLLWRLELIVHIIPVSVRNRYPIFSWVERVHKLVKCLATGHNNAAHRSHRGWNLRSSYNKSTALTTTPDSMYLQYRSLPV